MREKKILDNLILHRAITHINYTFILILSDVVLVLTNLKIMVYSSLRLSKLVMLSRFQLFTCVLKEMSTPSISIKINTIHKILHMT